MYSVHEERSASNLVTQVFVFVFFSVFLAYTALRCIIIACTGFEKVGGERAWKVMQVTCRLQASGFSV